MFLLVSKKDPIISSECDPKVEKCGFGKFKIGLRVLKMLFPLLLLLLILYVNDSIIWTIGPLLSDYFPGFDNFGGWFITLNMLPWLFIIFIVPGLINKFGKKSTAYLSFLVSLLLYSTFIFLNNSVLILLISFVASAISYFAFPAIKSAFADYLDESKESDSMIMGLEDIFVNLGYIVGPLIIGLSSDIWGGLKSIGIVSLVSFFIVLVLYFITPKTISFKKF